MVMVVEEGEWLVMLVRGNVSMFRSDEADETVFWVTWQTLSSDIPCHASSGEIVPSLRVVERIQ